jgi:alcohol dehydrogenase class IV
MNNFTFQTAKTIINQPGISNKLGDVIKEMNISRLLLVTDSGIVNTGMAEKIITQLKESGLNISVFDKVKADPPVNMILDAVTLGSAEKVNGVIGLGGGSSLDTAKLVAFLVNSSQTLEDIYGIGMAKGSRLPLILVPTTAGTGSEVTPISIVTKQDNQKMGIISPLLLPDIAILDAELTLSLPAAVTAATGVDAMVHAIEAYTTKIRKNPISDMMALKALDLLASNIRLVIEDGRSLEARSGMLLGSMLAGQAFTNAPVAAVHALAYPLGGHFHVPHGLSNSLMLPHVMKFNTSVIQKQYAELAQVIFPSEANMTDQALSEKFIQWLEELTKEIGLETQLRQVKIQEKDLELLAKDAMKQERLLQNNPREVTYEDALNIYKAAF